MKTCLLDIVSRGIANRMSYLLPLITTSHILDSSTVRTFERLSMIQLNPIKNHVRKIRNRPCRGRAVFQTEEGSCRSKNRHPTTICNLWRLVRSRRVDVLLKGRGNDSSCIGWIRTFDIFLRKTFTMVLSILYKPPLLSDIVS